MTADRAAFLLLVLLDDVKHKFWSFPSRLKTQIESELPLKARPSRFREPRFHGRHVGPVLFATKVRKRRPFFWNFHVKTRKQDAFCGDAGSAGLW